MKHTNFIQLIFLLFLSFVGVTVNAGENAEEKIAKDSVQKYGECLMYAAIPHIKSALPSQEIVSISHSACSNESTIAKAATSVFFDKITDVNISEDYKERMKLQAEYKMDAAMLDIRKNLEKVIEELRQVQP